MRRHGIRALAGRRFRPCTTDSRHDLPITPNLLKQDFPASRPDMGWLGDLTYLPTGEGWLYLAAVLDLATRKVVGGSMRDHMRSALTVAALMMATQRQRPATGLICHSDRGSQYAAEAYRKQLADMKAIPSHKPDGLLLRQRPDGELLPHAEGRAFTPATMGNLGRSPTRLVHLYRRLLQATAHPLCIRLYHARASRAERKLTPRVPALVDETP